MWETEIRRILVRGQPRQIVLKNPISKITRAQWTGGVVQVVERLFCMHETLSSNPNCNKRKKGMTLLCVYRGKEASFYFVTTL
jgi:hypothetical protein